MALDRTSIDKARELNNLPPISDEEFASLSGNGASEEEKKALAAEAKKKEQELPEGKTKEEQLGQTKPEELSDDELIKILNSRTGRQLKSFDELKPTPTQIDKEKELEERESNKLLWGLQNKKVDKKSYEGFIADSKDRTSVVFRQYMTEALAEDNTLTEDEIKIEFDNRFGIDAKPESREYKRGQKELNLLADNILKNSYSPIYNLEKDYSAFETHQQKEAEKLNKVKAGLPVYNKVVDDAISKLKKIKAQFSDKDEYEVSAIPESELDKSITEIAATLRNQDFIVQKIIGGYTPEEIADVAYTMYLRTNFPILAKEIGKQMLLKHSAGVQGIPKLGKILDGETEYNLTEAQQKMVDLHKQNNQQLAATN